MLKTEICCTNPLPQVLKHRTSHLLTGKEWTKERREGIWCAGRSGSVCETEKEGERKNCVDGDILAFWLPEFKRLSPTTLLSYFYVAYLINSELDQKLYWKLFSWRILKYNIKYAITVAFLSERNCCWPHILHGAHSSHSLTYDYRIPF